MAHPGQMLYDTNHSTQCMPLVVLLLTACGVGHCLSDLLLLLLAIVKTALTLWEVYFPCLFAIGVLHTIPWW
jgi:hypothetical protein